jgi:uncharacterized caspase-like protein
MEKTLTSLLLFFAAALLFTAQAQSTKAIRKKVSTTADSGRRTALVIGNAAYASKPLRNSVNDARAMSRTLRELGFSVELLEDASQKAMKKAIDRFGEQLRGGGTGLFYFSGHGIQVSGRNYLIPVQYTITSEDDVEYESVDAGRVLAKMKSARNGMNIVILDACRNNPFPSSFRSASQGLATINAPSGTFISYATAPGSVASDGSGNTGLYTGELIRHMKSPGLKLEEVFKKVRTDVQKKSSDKQVPWDASSLTGDFYFVPPTVALDSGPEVAETASVTDSASKPKVSAAPRKFRADEEMWELLKKSNDPEDFKYFLEEFPESPLNSVARLKLRKLKKAQKKLAAKQKPASSSQYGIISQSKPKNSVESSLPQKNISIKEGFEKCEGRDFCLRKVANTNSMTLSSLKRMAKVYGWKGAEPQLAKAPTGTVTDSSTGLMWQKKTDGVQRKWDDAKKYCRNLNYGGFSDWKLPSRDELEMGFKVKHLFDPFKRQDWDSLYWSSTNDVLLTTHSLRMHFSSAEVSSNTKAGNNYVRCVRGGWGQQESESKQSAWSPAGTVIDSSTGLMWQKKPDGKQRNWDNSKRYCRNLNHGGFSDWKLPNGKELRHVLRNKHILDPYKISSKWDSSFWSSQTASYLNAYLVKFGTGKSIPNQKRFKYYVRCVREGKAHDSQKITKKKNENTSKTASRASIRQTYDKAVKQNSIFGFRNFIKEYEHESKAKYYLRLVKKKLKKLEGANETPTTSSSEASSGYTKRQAYLDFLEAKVSNTKTALRNFLRKHAKTTDSESYRVRARKLIKNF